MSFLESLFRRFGYIKIERYGLTLAPNGHIVPMTSMGPEPWQSHDGLSMPLAAPPSEETLRRAPTPYPPPIHAGPTEPPRSVAPPPVPAAASPGPAPAAATQPTPVPVVAAGSGPQQRAASESDDEDEGDWEWKLAMARAKAREDITQIIPKSQQAAAAPPPLRRPPRSTPPAPPMRRAARATAAPRAPRPLHPRLPGLPRRPSDQPLGRPLGEETQVDARAARAFSNRRR